MDAGLSVFALLIGAEMRTKIRVSLHLEEAQHETWLP